MNISSSSAAVFVTILLLCESLSAQSNPPSTVRHDIEVYNKHVRMTFAQNPDVVIDALMEQEKRRRNRNNIKQGRRPRPYMRSQRVLIDQNNNHYVWDDRFGHMPVLPLPLNYPVMWVDGPEGPLAIPLGMEPVLPMVEPVFLLNARSDAEVCDPNRSSSVQKKNEPMMSFYEPPVDACTGKPHSEFAITATSGMADILCMLCQYLRSKRCVWQFCVHPEGVYKINISEDLKT